MMDSRREQGVLTDAQTRLAGDIRDRGAMQSLRRETSLRSGNDLIEAIVSEIVNARVGEMIDENHNLARKAAVLAGRI
jgi:hypothetical protein